MGLFEIGDIGIVGHLYRVCGSYSETRAIDVQDRRSALFSGVATGIDCASNCLNRCVFYRVIFSLSSLPMKLYFSSRGLVGENSADYWTEIRIVPTMGMIVEAEGKDAALVGRAFITAVEKLLHQNKITSSSEFKKILRSARGQDQRLRYAAVMAHQDKVFVTSEKGGEVWLRRGDKQGKVLSGSSTGTGAMKTEDILILVNNQMRASLTETHLREALRHNDVKEILQVFSTTSKKDSTKGTALVLKIVPDVTGEMAEKVTAPISRAITVVPSITRKAISVLAARRRYVGIFLVVVFILIAGSFWYRREYIVSSQATHDTVLELQQNLKAATALIPLNPLKAREALITVKTRTDDIDQRMLSKKEQRQITEVLAAIDEALLLSLKKYEVQLKPFFEVSLTKQEAQIDDLSLYQDALFLLDKQNRAVYRINLGTKASRIVVGGKDFNNFQHVLAYGEEVYLFSPDGIQKVGASPSLVPVISKNPQWGTIRDMAAFGGNLYLLDTAHHLIWKYIVEETAFGEGQNYLLSDSKPNLSNAYRLAVDGSVWVVNDSEVLRFIQGEELFWQMKGLDESITTITDLFTDEHTANLYLLDTQKKRVVVLNKDGMYIAQYTWKENISPTRLVASEVLKQILLFTSDTIYSIDIK